MYAASFSYPEEGSYNVELTIITEDDCMAEANTVLDIFTPLNPTFTVIEHNLCMGISATFCPDDTSGTSYEWLFNDGCMTTPSGQAGGDCVNHLFQNSGSFVVHLLF